MKINIAKYKSLFFILSSILVGAAVVFMFVYGFKEGIDFTGGSLWQFKITPAPSASEVQDFLKSKGLEAIVNFDYSNQSFLVRLPLLTEDEHNNYLNAFKSNYNFEELSFQSVGPSVSQDLRKSSLIAILLVILGISLYIAFAFRKVSKPISSWKYGIVTLITLFHDVAIPTGLLVLLGKFKGVEIDTNFIVALLVVMGFSVHDTIVVFDRIRENILLDRGRSEFGAIINNSVSQTLARSINTSLTLVLVLIALYIFGPLTLKYFVLTLLVGTITGTYSSIFIASPLLLVWEEFGKRKK